MKPENKKLLIAVVITFIVTLVISTTCYFISSAVGFPKILMLHNAAKIITNSFYKDVDINKLYDGAVKGMMESLNDEYSWYVDKTAYKELTNSMDGSYTGIGVVVAIDPNDKLLTVISPIEDTPAAKAGLSTGDKIISINGITAGESNYREAINSMRGGEDAVGKKVDFILRKKGSDKDEQMSLIREKIILKTVKSRQLEGGIAYVRITNFDLRTDAEFDDAIEKLDKKNIKGLVLDLRNNPGGLLESTKNIANELLPEGMITYFLYRDGTKQEHKSDGKNYWDVPITVLINGGSASASEVLSGAIKDRGRGVLIGTKSYGKGVVQSVLPLSIDKDGQNAIYITTSRYFTPNGSCIDKIGIQPDIEVKLPPDLEKKTVAEIPPEQDVQLKRAVEEVKKKIKY